MTPTNGGVSAKRSESKRDRFKRLAEARTKTVLAKLKVLGNCASRSTYEYTAEDVKKIFRAIRERVGEIEARFSESSEKDEFKL
jgi:hypothetical protein